MAEDSGTRLRSLYQPTGGVKQVFSSKVADYVASRPDYPAPLFEMLRTTGNLQAGSVVADIGAGTGLLTRGLLQSECLRVLRPEGKVALIWNDRLFSDPLQIALDEVFAEYGGSKRAALAVHEQQRNDIPTFFGETVPAQFSYPYEHSLDEAGLVSLVFSRSYMPDRESSASQKVKDSVRQIFQRFSASGLVKVRYVTTACVGRPHSS